MTVLSVCTAVFVIVVVRDTVSEEGLCRGCGGTCLTFGGAVTTEEFAPCSLWKKDDMVGSKREKVGGRKRGGGEERGRGEKQRVSSIVFVRAGKAQKSGISNQSNLVNMHDYVSSHLRNRSLFSNLVRWRAPIWSRLLLSGYYRPWEYLWRLQKVALVQ
jgi:hypothetical protein